MHLGRSMSTLALSPDVGPVPGRDVGIRVRGEPQRLRTAALAPPVLVWAFAFCSKPSLSLLSSLWEIWGDILHPSWFSQ